PPHRQPHDDTSASIDDKRSAIEDELVLATDLVDVREREPALGHAFARQRDAPIELRALERGSIRDHEDLGAALREMPGHAREPDVLADRGAEADASKVDRIGQR